MATSGIRKFYKDSTILITGSTGFLGQVLLEKILHALEPRKVYLLIRNKKNLDPNQRLQSILDGVLFERVRSSTAIKHLVPIAVDMGREDLGIDSKVRLDLQQNVDIVFSLAAAVSFVNPLHKALQENTENVLNLFHLVKDMHNLRSGIHVSTMFTNSDRNTIEDKVYTDVSFGGFDVLNNLLPKLDDSECQELTSMVLKKNENTYTFSKKCAEVKLQHDFASLPIGIFRSPIISSIYRGPVAGWTNNIYGIGGLLVPLIFGLYSSVLADPIQRAMIAPVDYCVNALLLAAVDTNSHFSPSNTIVPVYNYATSNVPTYQEMFSSFTDGAMRPWQAFFYRNFMTTVTSDVTRYKFAAMFMRVHASLADRMRTRRGQHPLCRKVVENAIRASLNSPTLTSKSWQIETANVDRLRQGLNDEEAELFYSDLDSIDWPKHLRTFVPGLRKYVFAGKL